MKYPQKYDSDQPILIVLDDIKEKELNDPRKQAIYKRSKHNSISYFKISQDYYELPAETVLANGNKYYLYKPNNFRDAQKVHQDRASTDTTPNEFNLLTSTC